MKPRNLLFILLHLFVLLSPLYASEPFLVEKGAPRAQIVIAAENRPRMATLAALELQRHIQTDERGAAADRDESGCEPADQNLCRQESGDGQAGRDRQGSEIRCVPNGFRAGLAGAAGE